MLKLLNFILLLILMLLQACSMTGSNSSDNKHNLTHPRLHAVMTDRISVLLDQMDTLMTDQNRTEIELDQDRKYKALRIADSAAELQRTVDIILAIQPTLDLSEHEAPVFIKLANQLKEQGAELEHLAQNNQIDALKPAMKRTKNTCMTCHSLFRDN
jgi:hypothetical protein